MYIYMAEKVYTCLHVGKDGEGNYNEKMSKVQDASCYEGTAGGIVGEEGEVGFDDPFFQHNVYHSYCSE